MSYVWLSQLQIITTKSSSDEQFTLLDYLIIEVRAANADLADFKEDLQNVPEASKGKK